MSLLKGGIATVESSTNDADWTDLGDFIEEGTEPPATEGAELVMGDGSSAQAGERLTFAVAFIESDVTATRFADVKTANDAGTKIYIRFTGKGGDTIKTQCRVRLASQPIKQYGGVGTLLITGTATSGTPGGTYTFTAAV